VQGNLYVGVSAQVTLQKRLDTIAHNVANANTAGFRAEEVRFETALSRAGADPIAFAVSGPTYLSRRSGDIVRTDNQFDVAVDGNAWLAIQTPTGQAYTRDGRMRMTAVGEMQTLNGYPVLDTGGAPVVLDPNAGPPRIARDGAIFQANRQIGAIGLFTIEEAANLTRFENSAVIPDRREPGGGFHPRRHAPGLHRGLQRQRRHGDEPAHFGDAGLRDGFCIADRLGVLAAGSH